MSITKILFSAAACVLLSDCVSKMQAPAYLNPPSCSTDSVLPGSWRSSRLSQIGPASMSFRFNCDCTYVATVRLLLKTIHEKGTYWVQDDQLSLSRASGRVTSWSFSATEDQLFLEEHPGETHAYIRKATLSCPE